MPVWVFPQCEDENVGLIRDAESPAGGSGSRERSAKKKKKKSKKLMKKNLLLMQMMHKRGIILQGEEQKYIYAFNKHRGINRWELMCELKINGGDNK